MIKNLHSYDFPHVSYSQFEIYHTCPLRWYGMYVAKLIKPVSNVYLVFGSTIHSVIQDYLDDSSNRNEGIDYMYNYGLYFLEVFYQNIKNELYNENLPVNYVELLQMKYCGPNIVREFLTSVNDIFGERWEYIGSEIFLKQSSKNNKNVFYSGSVDVITKKDNMFYIWDLKTSTNGWSNWEFNNDIKKYQLLFYRLMYSNNKGIPMDNIDVAFVILKRKVMFQKFHIQMYKPSFNKEDVDRCMTLIDGFIKDRFKENGQYVTTIPNPSPGKNFVNCKFCEFKDRSEFCSVNVKL